MNLIELLIYTAAWDLLMNGPNRLSPALSRAALDIAMSR